MQAEVDGRHAEVPARRVHDAIVVGEREGPRASEGVPCNKGNGGEGEVDKGGEEGEEAFGVGVGVCVGFIEFEALVCMLTTLKDQVDAAVAKCGSFVGHNKNSDIP